MNLEVGSHQTLNLPTLWSWTSQPPEIWEVNAVYIPLSLWYFCYNSSDVPRHKQCLMPGKHTWDIQDLVQRERVQVYVKSLNHVWLSVILWTAVCQAPPSMGFPRQEFWSGLPFPSPGDLPDLGIEPGSPAWQADTSPSEPPGKPWATLLTQAERFQLPVDCFWDLNVPCILCLAIIKLDLIYNLCSLHNDKIFTLSQRVLGGH